MTKPLPFAIEDDLKNHEASGPSESLQSRTALTAHTPGPWVACRDADCACGTIFGADGNTTVGRVYGEADLDNADQVPLHRTQKANARLIAAAPDLFAIAIRVAVYFEDTNGDLGADARAAVAKALGADHSVRDASSTPQLSHCGSPKATGAQS